MTVASAPQQQRHQRAWPAWINVSRRSLQYRQMTAGLVVTGFVVLLAIFGPMFAPHSPATYVAPPFSPPSRHALLGTDFLGDDVFSRVLYGGRTVVVLSLAATTFGMLLGLCVGLIAGYSRSLFDDVLMGVNDVILAFPQLVLVLVFVSVLGPRLWLIVFAVGLSHSPRVTRLVRSLTLEVREREFLQSAELLGVPRRRIVLQDVFPNLSTPLLIEFGLRLTWSIAIIAGLSFLGFGIQPPHADWGLMINENRGGLSLNVWSVAAPVLCIFLFTLGTNLMTDGMSRAAAGIDRGGGAK